MTSQVQVLESIRDVLSGKDLGKKSGPETQEPTSEDEVLDLTQMLNDDGSITDLANITEGQNMAQNESSTDVLGEIDKLLGDNEQPAAEIDIDAIMAAAPAPEPEAAPQAEPEQPSITADETDIILTAPTVQAAEFDNVEDLISSEAANKAKSAISDMLAKTGKKEAAHEHTPAPSFRNGDTVEDLVMEGLRPMLKAWLDTNLPSLVEEIVQREIAKIIPR